MQLNVNGQIHNIDVEPNMPLLWAIRESLGLTGTKYGCGVAQCGSCSVYLNGELVRSCAIPVSAVGSAKITTIEALSKDNSHPVQKAWIALDVPQCGYCQSGQVMAAAALLKKIPKPSDADIDSAMANVCRCGTYQKIRDGIHVASGQKTLAEVLAQYDATPATRG
jgi:isoquinoline 1-oxidoreductase alpha subunit